MYSRDKNTGECDVEKCQLEKGSEWIMPQALSELEVKISKLLEEGDPNASGHLEAYYLLNNGLDDGSRVSGHAIFNDQLALDYVMNLKKFFIARKYLFRGSLLDVGSGLGAVTAAFLDVGIERSMGVEISKNACAYAVKQYKKCMFYCQSADDLSAFPDEGFDIIHIKEFYPFSRTAQFDFHFQFLKVFYQKLARGGKIVICQRWTSKSIFTCFESFSTFLKKQFLPMQVQIEKIVLIPPVAGKLFGTKTYSFPYSLILCWLTRLYYFIRQKPLQFFVIIHKG